MDEYDKPILDLLEEPEVARANRGYLRGLYGVIKDRDAHVRFTFLTGISKFSKVTLFSQLNNLTDITLDPAYSSLRGYTEDDPEAVFAPELGGLDREQVREWYHGSSWLGAEKVYNPYDVLLLRRGEPIRMGGSRCRAGAAGLCEGQPINLIGVEFSRATRNVTAFEVAAA